LARLGIKTHLMDFQQVASLQDSKNGKNTPISCYPRSVQGFQQ
jgi:hypothetical protein